MDNDDPYTRSRTPIILIILIAAAAAAATVAWLFPKASLGSSLAHTVSTVWLRWIAELLDSEWGVVQFADTTKGAQAIRAVADSHRKIAAGEEVGQADWLTARSAARSIAAEYAALSAAEYAVRTAAEYAVVVEFTATAIAAWRRLGNLDTPTELTADAVNDAIVRIVGPPT